MTYLLIHNTKTDTFAALIANDQQVTAFEDGDVGGPEFNGWIIDGESTVPADQITGKQAAEFLASHGVQTPARIKTRDDIRARIFKALPDIAVPFGEYFAAEAHVKPASGGDTAKKPAKPAKAPKAKKPATAKADKPKRQKGIVSYPPLEIPRACRADTKQAALIDALFHGATLSDLRKATAKRGKMVDWTDASIRSALAYDVHAVKGYGVRTEVLEDGTPKYFLVLPEGYDAPVPHKPRAS